MLDFPRSGRCLCGAVEYRLLEDPLTVYLCHCTDCQTESGASFALSMIVRHAAIETLTTAPQETRVQMDDGRIKRSYRCDRCRIRVWGASSESGFAVIAPGTLDDTSWFHPVGHIWTRSAQPWFEIPKDTITIEQQPRPEEVVELVRAWKNRRATAD
jgi:hypothetical protein